MKTIKIIETLYAYQFPARDKDNQTRIILDYQAVDEDKRTQKSFEDAHDIANFILKISKQKFNIHFNKEKKSLSILVTEGEKNESKIHPRIELDEEKQLFYVSLSTTEKNLLLSKLELLKYTKLNDDNAKVRRQKNILSIQKAIARVVAPLAGSNFSQKFKGKAFGETFEPYEAPEGIEGENFDVLTKDGNYIDAGMLYRTDKKDSTEYVINCHGNTIHYRQLLPFYQQLAQNTDCKIIGFDYRGYGLSAGKVIDKKDLYNDAFAVAKDCVDKGATYVLLEGISLGGAVASKTANRLRKYCASIGKDVLIEHTNNLSFSTVSNQVKGFLRETNFETGDRKKPGLLRRFFVALLSPLINFVLKHTGWDMNPQKDLQKMPENTFEVMSAKNDDVIGTYASMEYQLRKQNQKEWMAIHKKIAETEKLIEQTKDILRVYLKPDVKDIPHNLRTLNSEELAHFMIQDNGGEETLKRLASYEVELNRLQLQARFKESRLMATDDTRDCADFTAERDKNTHNRFLQLKSSNTTALDREIAFINSRGDRTRSLPTDFSELIAMKSRYQKNLSLFQPSNAKVDASTNTDEKVASASLSV